MLIDGAKIAREIQHEIQAEIERLSGRKPCLAVVLVGDHPPSQIYIERKTAACERVGIRSIRKKLPANTSEATLLKEIASLNNDPLVDGILVQLPLPSHLNPLTIIEHLSPEKDVDGLHPLNTGKLLIGARDGFVPCTPLGVQALLVRSGIPIEGQHVVIIGRSNLVGKPLAALLLQNQAEGNATVTIVHRHTRQLAELCQQADILVAALGSPHFVTPNMVKKGAVVIDVGINKILDPHSEKGYQIVGDVAFAAVKDKCSAITPVPGGVGPMTIAMLLSNTWKSFCQRSNR